MLVVDACTLWIAGDPTYRSPCKVLSATILCPVAHINRWCLFCRWRDEGCHLAWTEAQSNSKT